MKLSKLIEKYLNNGQAIKTPVVNEHSTNFKEEATVIECNDNDTTGANAKEKENTSPSEFNCSFSSAVTSKKEVA